ncbi:hypothetical protein BC332_34489 [Capsicum chinense]|nr:hypothetical protein BC332_34489 [Capsicum chinense]
MAQELCALQLQPLINRIKEIGESYSKTPTQVVLNWLIAQDNVVPIPGAKNAEQAKEFAGALGWRLTQQEIGQLRSLASDLKPVTESLGNVGSAKSLFYCVRKSSANEATTIITQLAEPVQRNVDKGFPGYLCGACPEKCPGDGFNHL